MRLRLSSTRRRLRPILKPHRFENAVKSGAFSKRYGFTGRYVLIWREIGGLATSKHCEPRTECSACLYIHFRKILINVSLSMWLRCHETVPI